MSLADTVKDVIKNKLHEDNEDDVEENKGQRELGLEEKMLVLMTLYDYKRIRPHLAKHLGRLEERIAQLEEKAAATAPPAKKQKTQE
jgi:hypothetical protein